MKMTWLAITLSLVSFSSLSSPWESFSQPNRLAPEAIGSYANGCLFGAKALPLKGYGYQVLRSQNQRYYGHPDTISFIERLSKKSRQDLRTHLLIGDMSLPQGGRFSSGHSSHQTGLDVDIWLRLADGKFSDAALQVPTPKSLVNMSTYKLIPSHWDSRHFSLMKMAAQDEDVARIFVHPLIKEKLCSLEGGERSWLRKIRPWWGHNYHMHVRLHCPDGESRCVEQSPPPKGDGCGMEVASWHPKSNVKAYKAKAKGKNSPVAVAKTKPKPKKNLPQQCAQLVDQTH